MQAFYTNKRRRQRDQMRVAAAREYEFHAVFSIDAKPCLQLLDWMTKLSDAFGMGAGRDSFDNLDVGGRGIAAVARAPRWPVYLALGLAIVIAWALLASMAAEIARLRPPGFGAPGDAILQYFPDWQAPPLLGQFIALCLTPASVGDAPLTAFATAALMWVLMSVAMMLPSAAPMIRTYCEIADTAANKGEDVVHPVILVAGYLVVWLAASLCFAALTLFVQRIGGGVLEPASIRIAGIALLTAGAYQFSNLKHACLEKCRNPFGTLFARWTTSRNGIFRLGVQQGVWCLGCCWALMLVMFAVGIMNIFWMALIGLFTLFEKETNGRLASGVSGAILLVWGLSLLVLSI
jgi:predicted metal-binding membrane protein